MECKQQAITAAAVVRQTALAWILLSIVMSLLIGKCLGIYGYLHACMCLSSFNKFSFDIESKRDERRGRKALRRDTYTQLDASFSLHWCSLKPNDTSRLFFPINNSKMNELARTQYSRLSDLCIRLTDRFSSIKVGYTHRRTGNMSLFSPFSREHMSLTIYRSSRWKGSCRSGWTFPFPCIIIIIAQIGSQTDRQTVGDLAE